MKYIIKITGNENILIPMQDKILKKMKKKYPKEYNDGNLWFIFGRKKFEIITTDKKLIKDTKKDFKKLRVKLGLSVLKRLKINFNFQDIRD